MSAAARAAAARSAAALTVELHISYLEEVTTPTLARAGRVANEYSGGYPHVVYSIQQCCTMVLNTANCLIWYGTGQGRPASTQIVIADSELSSRFGRIIPHPELVWYVGG
eukprot:5817761-Prymnesium_polylepis.1